MVLFYFADCLGLGGGARRSSWKALIERSSWKEFVKAARRRSAARCSSSRLPSLQHDKTADRSAVWRRPGLALRGACMRLRRRLALAASLDLMAGPLTAAKDGRLRPQDRRTCPVLAAPQSAATSFRSSGAGGLCSITYRAVTTGAVRTDGAQEYGVSEGSHSCVRYAPRRPSHGPRRRAGGRFVALHVPRRCIGACLPACLPGMERDGDYCGQKGVWENGGKGKTNSGGRNEGRRRGGPCVPRCVRPDARRPFGR